MRPRQCRCGYTDQKTDKPLALKLTFNKPIGLLMSSFIGLHFSNDSETK